MAKLTLSDLTSLSSNETSSVNTINANSALIEAALENTLSRDGTTPNTMSADLDMNSQSILNVGGISIPGGGDLADYVDYAEEWANKAEDSLVSTLAGGNGVDEYSALHWAAKADADATQTALDVISTASDAAAAAASAALAAASAGAGPYTTVTLLTTGTYDIEVADSRTYYVCDTSGGTVTINLPAIGSDEGLTYGAERSGAGDVTMVRDGTDYINGVSGNYTLSANTEVVQFISDDATPDNWIANVQSQTLAGSGLSKTGSTMSLDLTSDQSWTGSQRTTPVTDADGSFDMDAGNDFLWTPAGVDVLEFTNETEGQRGLIRLVNTTPYAITLGSEVEADADAATTLSTAGTYLISYWCYDGTNVAISYSAALV